MNRTSVNQEEHSLRRKERERHALRNDILLAALELYQTKSSAFTIQEVADRVGIAKGSVYLFFTSKADLLEALVLHTLDRLQGLFEQYRSGRTEPLERLLGMGQAYIELYAHHPQEFALISELDFLTPGLGWAETSESELGRRARALKEVLLLELRAGQADGSIRKDLDPTLMSLVLSQVVKSFMQSLARAERQSDVRRLSGYSPSQLIEALFALLRQALSNPGGAQ